MKSDTFPEKYGKNEKYGKTVCSATNYLQQ